MQPSASQSFFSGMYMFHVADSGAVMGVLRFLHLIGWNVPATIHAARLAAAGPAAF